MDSDLDQCWKCRRRGKFYCEKCKFTFYCSKECQKSDYLRHTVDCERLVNRRTCSGCGTQPEVLLRCASCFLAFYCNKTCQKRHWPQHKNPCKKFQRAALGVALSRLQFIDSIKTAAKLPRYIGSQNAEDFLHLRQNEGKATDGKLRLLFVGADDIKNVVRTVVDLPDEFSGKLHFVVNLIGPHVAARNLLFLYCMIIAPRAEHLVQIWYSLRLTAEVLKYLASRLKELTTTMRQDIISKMRNIVSISEDHWNQCLQVWKGWYKLALDPYAVDRMMNLRQERLSLDDESFTAIYQDSIPEEHVASVLDFTENGLLLPLGSASRREAVFPNCTLTYYNPLHPKKPANLADIVDSKSWDGWRDIVDPDQEMTSCLLTDYNVLLCWDYLAVKETVGKKDDVLDMYSLYLEKIFKTFAEKISNVLITFNFVIDDFQKLDHYLLVDEVFDRIAISYISDFYSYPLLLKQFGPRLNKDNSCSVLITCHVAWSKIRNAGSFYAYSNRDVISRVVSDKVQMGEKLIEVNAADSRFFLMSSVADYIDSTQLFLSWLAADSIIYFVENCKQPFSKTLIKHPSSVAQMFGLCLRDYCSELNRVVPFLRDTGERRISQFLPNTLRRYVEWTLSQSDKP